MKFFAPAPLALLFPGLCLISAVHAEPLELDPSVITGSRSASPSFDVPYSVDSINQQQIKDGQLGINASEVLSRVPGLVVQNRQNYAQDLQISSRGFGARSAFGVRGIKLIADGIPASTPDGQGQAATFNLDTAERIEVLRQDPLTVHRHPLHGQAQLRTGGLDPRRGKGFNQYHHLPQVQRRTACP